MKKLILLSLIFLSSVAQALTISTGTYYFDNSKTQYTSVKFVYGTSSASYVVTMPTLSTDIQGWSKSTTYSLSMSSSVSHIERYFFAETSLEDGTYNKAISTLKDEIAGSRNEKRTATRTDDMPVGQIFVPNNNEQWAQGNWQSLTTPKAQPSGTLPVLYINTKGKADIVSKDDYLKAYFWLDNMGIEQYKSIASEAKPDTMQIKGRGNYTWRDFDKKPYRLKLDNKTALMGLPKSKHWTLLAHADDTWGFLKNPCGFWFSEHLGLAWTPRHEAVELVLNGDYRGLYFLTEQIRVDKDRVNIVEQEDGCTNADSITGGWLVEIDNYWEDEPLQVHKTEGDGSNLWVTLHTPEETSSQQWNYINNAIVALNEAIYGTDEAFDSKVDLESAAKFYIVQELMGNRESYHGSCYFYKDMGADAKWFWGPVWDFGNSLYDMSDAFIYERFPYAPQNWVGQMNSHPNFHAAIVKAWKHFLYYEYANFESYLTDYAQSISAAVDNDKVRWPNYGNTNEMQKKNEVVNLIRNRVQWLKKQWGEGEPDPTDLLQPEGRSFSETVLQSEGRSVLLPNGSLVIYHQGHLYSPLGIVLE